MSEGMSPEEQERLARELADELAKLRVEDVLVNTLMHVSSIGYRRLGATGETREERDLDQTRLAIETMRALAPVLERVLPAELVRDFNQSVANLQLAYAKAMSESGAAPRPAEAAPEPETPGAPAEGTQAEDKAAEDVGAGASAGEASDAAQPEGEAGDEPRHD